MPPRHAAALATPTGRPRVGARGHSQDAGRRRAVLASVLLHLGASALLAAGPLRPVGSGPAVTARLAVAEPAADAAEAVPSADEAGPDEQLFVDWPPPAHAPEPEPESRVPPLAPEWEPPLPEPGPAFAEPPPTLPVVLVNRRRPPSRPPPAIALPPPAVAAPRAPPPPPVPAPAAPAPVPVPTAAATPGERVRVLFAPDPRLFYPPQGRREGWQGETLLRLDLDAEGRVAASRVLRSSGHPELDAAARRYAAAMRFSPGADGRSLRLPVRFELNGA